MCDNIPIIGRKKPKTQPLPPLPKPVEKKEPDVQVSGKKARSKKRSTSSNRTGLNRFLIVPGSSGSGANVPE